MPILVVGVVLAVVTVIIVIVIADIAVSRRSLSVSLLLPLNPIFVNALVLVIVVLIVANVVVFVVAHPF